MPDLQIPAPGVKAAPLIYTVPGSVEMIVKAAFATFNGAGAGGAFLPCLRVLSPAGLVVGEYVTDSSVAAGSSAEVSFAPFLRGATAGGAAAATPDYATAQRDITAIAFASGGANSYPADYFDIGNTAMYADDGTGKLNVLQAGLYEVTMTVQAYSSVIPATAVASLNQQFSSGGFPNDHTLNDQGTHLAEAGTTLAGVTYWNVWQQSWLDLNSPPCSMWFIFAGGAAVHTLYDSANASIRVVRLTEASSAGVS